MKRDRPPAGSDHLSAFLGGGTTFQDTRTFEGTVRIDGRLEGEILTKDTLVIGERAAVQATIHAGVPVIGGPCASTSRPRRRRSFAPLPGSSATSALPF